MKTANLYATTDVSLVSRRDLQYRAVPVVGHGVIYVRAELVECAPIDALDRVRCLPNEIQRTEATMKSEKALYKQQWGYARRLLRDKGRDALLNPHAMIGKICGCGKCFCCAALGVLREHDDRVQS